MSRNNVPLAVLACAIVLALAALVIVLRLHDAGNSASPVATTTVIVTPGPTTAPPSSAPASATPASTAPASTAPASTVLTDFTVCITPAVTCNGEMHAEPPQIIVSGDGSAFVGGLTWTGWGSSGATGSGTLKLDNCEPSCAQGTYTPYQATVTLSGLAPYGSAGQQGYADMTVSAPGSPYGTHSYSGLLP
jgi:hypothetical protein